MNFKKIISTFLLATIVASGTIIANSNNVNAKTLHPLGLRTLHEKIQNIKKLPSYHLTNKALPSSVDLASKFPAVQDQGSLGSCVTFATTYDKDYEENVKRNWGLSTSNHLFSQSYIYSQIHGDDSADGGGATFSDAFNLLESQGDTTLNDMPYDGDDYGWETTPTRAQKKHAASYKATNWSELDDGNYTEIKQELAKGTPVVIGISVYPDFDNISPSNPIFDKISGTNRGGHALCVIGYDDSKQAVKIINSWGKSWGLNGYGWISYKVLQQEGVEAYVLND